ncbi:GD16629 [Drosophila simulans]|uniref:GD16629 n=1 Tax=Drosophila simulans TaxID=7240 RepID=B4R3W1_DROSI|nr:GD16629 [Drosophila simulans]
MRHIIDVEPSFLACIRIFLQVASVHAEASTLVPFTWRGKDALKGLSSDIASPAAVKRFIFPAQNPQEDENMDVDVDADGVEDEAGPQPELRLGLLAA